MEEGRIIVIHGSEIRKRTAIHSEISSLSHNFGRYNCLIEDEGRIWQERIKDSIGENINIRLRGGFHHKEPEEKQWNSLVGVVCGNCEKFNILP